MLGPGRRCSVINGMSYQIKNLYSLFKCIEKKLCCSNIWGLVHSNLEGKKMRLITDQASILYCTIELSSYTLNFVEV